MDVKEARQVKFRRRSIALSVRSVLLAGMVLGLSSCASVDSDATDDSTQTQSTMTATVTATAQASPAASNVPEISSVDIAEQQRLIEEINRDGAPLDFESLRETAPAPVAPQGDDVVELNYEQADLRMVLEELADAIDISLVADPSIDARVSVRTSANRPLSRDDIWPLIRYLTRSNGVTLEQLGDFWAAYAVTGGLPTEIVTPDTLDQTFGTTVMQVTPLTYVSPDTAIETLSPVLEEGSIIKLTSRNVLAISGTAYQLERVNQLLTLIDSDPFANQGIQLYQLRNASAEEVATELQEILTLIEGVSSYSVRGITRINSVLVTAPATRGFEEVSRWIRILDSENQEQAEQLFHYQVKNLSAVELAETLSNVFEENEDRFIPETQEILPPDSLLDAIDAEPVSEEFVDPGPQGNGAVSANLRVRIVADEATNSLLIRGTARDYRQLLTTINLLDAVPLQVVVNAVIAQISLDDDTRFGVDWRRVADNATVDDISTTTETNFTNGITESLLFTKSFVDGSARVDATLNAIAVNNEVSLLARPSITVTNNQEGQIQIGDDVPVQGGSTIGLGGQETFNIQYRETGIVLTITPQINADGVINLTIEQELSSLAGEGFNSNPIFRSQTISTSVVVRDGESVVLGGLIQTDQTDNNSGVPGLNRIPVIGNLFSFQENLLSRSELFIVLRPEVVNLNDNNSLDYEDILSRFELAAEMLGEEDI